MGSHTNQNIHTAYGERMNHPRLSSVLRAFQHLSDPEYPDITMGDSGRLAQRNASAHQIVNNVNTVFDGFQSSQDAGGQHGDHAMIQQPPGVDLSNITAGLTDAQLTQLSNLCSLEQLQRCPNYGELNTGLADHSVSDVDTGSMGVRGSTEQASSSQRFQSNWSGQDTGTRDDDEDEGGDEVGMSLSLPDSHASEERAKYTCPYYKLDPLAHKSCFGVGIKTVCSLRRNHLYKHHWLSEVQCDNCGAILTDMDAYNEHKPCEKRDFKPRLGVDYLMHKKLTFKGNARNGSEYDKWYNMFGILLNGLEGVQSPSDPYREDIPTFLGRVKIAIISLLPSIFSEALHSIYPSFNPVDFRQATQRVAEIRLAELLGIPSSPLEQDEGHLGSDAWDNYSGYGQLSIGTSSDGASHSRAGSSSTHQFPDGITAALDRARELFNTFANE